MRKPISQREALRLKKLVKQFEERDRARSNRYQSSYPGGVHLGNLGFGDSEIELRGMVKAAYALGHHVIGKPGDEDLMLYAVKP
jgi:cytidylate kinase